MQRTFKKEEHANKLVAKLRMREEQESLKNTCKTVLKQTTCKAGFSNSTSSTASSSTMQQPTPEMTKEQPTPEMAKEQRTPGMAKEQPTLAPDMAKQPTPEMANDAMPTTRPADVDMLASSSDSDSDTTEPELTAAARQTLLELLSLLEQSKGK